MGSQPEAIDVLGRTPINAACIEELEDTAQQRVHVLLVPQHASNLLARALATNCSGLLPTWSQFLSANSPSGSVLLTTFTYCDTLGRCLRA